MCPQKPLLCAFWEGIQKAPNTEGTYKESPSQVLIPTPRTRSSGLASSFSSEVKAGGKDRSVAELKEPLSLSYCVYGSMMILHIYLPGETNILLPVEFHYYRTCFGGWIFWWTVQARLHKHYLFIWFLFCFVLLLWWWWLLSVEGVAGYPLGFLSDNQEFKPKAGFDC